MAVRKKSLYKEVTESSSWVSDLLIKTVCLQQLKEMQRFKLGMWLFSFLFCYLCLCKRGTIWVNSRYTTGVPFLSIQARAPFPLPPMPLVRSSVPDCAISSLLKHYYQRMPMTCLCSLSGLNWTTNEIFILSNIPARAALLLKSM